MRQTSGQAGPLRHRSAERVPGTHHIPGHIVGSIENGMSELVRVVVATDGRDIIHGIEKRIEDNAPEDQRREDTYLFILPEEVRDSNHHGEQGEDPEDHAGDHANPGKTGRGHGVTFLEMLIYGGHVKGGCGRNARKDHGGRNEDPVPLVKLHITQ